MGIKKILPFNYHPESDSKEMCDQDRQWFVEHPNAHKYYRKPFACEIADAAYLHPGKIIKKVEVIRSEQTVGLRGRFFIFE